MKLWVLWVHVRTQISPFEKYVLFNEVYKTNEVGFMKR